jgi:DNA-binding LacI/PurR family transcriptional regulator
MRGGVEAVVAANDYTACGLIRAFAEQGYNVPADLSVIGADDVELAELCSPC